MVVAGIDQLVEKLKKSNELLELILKVRQTFLFYRFSKQACWKTRAMSFVSSCHSEMDSKTFQE